MIASRRVIVLGGSSLRPHRLLRQAVRGAQPAQLAFLDGLKALAKPALASGNPAADRGSRQAEHRPGRQGRRLHRLVRHPDQDRGHRPEGRRHDRDRPPSFALRVQRLDSGLCRLGPRPFLHTIARTAAAGPFRSRHRGAKNLAARRARLAFRQDGPDRRSGRVRLVPPVRQERGRAPPVPADAALRGAHRGAGGGRRRSRKEFLGAVLHVRFPLRHARSSRSSRPTSSRPRSISPPPPACACWPRAATRSMPRSPARSPSPSSSRP